MTPWIYILIGFVTFPVLWACYRLWIVRRSIVEPLVVCSAQGLQEKIGYLYRNGNDKTTLYVAESSTGFLLRLIKVSRKTKEDTIRVEIRATDKNEEGYFVARELLRYEGIDFEEKLTPKLKKPSRLFLKNEEGGVYTVSSVSRIASKIMHRINKEEDLNLLISDRDPHFWRKMKLRHNHALHSTEASSAE